MFHQKDRSLDKKTRAPAFLKGASARQVKVDDLSPDDIIIAVVGPTGSGKSTFINTITGLRIDVGHSLKPCTSEVTNVRLPIPEIAYGDLVFVDTPGFDDTHESEMDILEMVADWLKSTYQKDIKLSGLLYFHRISDNRMTSTPLKSLRILEELCGKNAFQSVILATTMWDEVDEETGLARERELKAEYWRTMLERQSTTSRFLRTRESAFVLIDPLIDKANKRTSILLQQEMVDMRKKLPATSAGQALFSTMEGTVRQREELLQRIRNEMKRADGDELFLKPLQEEHEKLRVTLESTVNEMRRLKLPMGQRFLNMAEKFFRSKFTFKLPFKSRPNKDRLKNIDDSAVKKLPISHSQSPPSTQSESDVDGLPTNHLPKTSVDQSEPTTCEEASILGDLAVDPKKPPTHIPCASISGIQSKSNVDLCSNPQFIPSRADRFELTRSEAEHNPAVYTPLPSTASIQSGQPSNPQLEWASAADRSKPTRFEQPTGNDGPSDSPSPSDSEPEPLKLHNVGPHMFHQKDRSLDKKTKAPTFVKGALARQVKVDDLSSDDIIIAVVGPTGSGKSTFINIITGLQIDVGHSLKPCTSEVTSVRLPIPELAYGDLVFVDTPGSFDDTHKSDMDILKMVADWLKSTYQKDIKLSGLLYFHRISDNRMTSTPLKSLRIIEELCGKNAFQSVILATTMWDEVDEETGLARERELKAEYWRTMLERQSTTSRFLLTRESAFVLIDPLIDKANKRTSILLQQEMVDMRKKLPATTAGQALFSTMEGIVRQREELLQRIRNEMKRADGDEVFLKPLREEHEKLRMNLESTVNEMRKLKLPMEQRFSNMTENFFRSKFTFKLPFKSRPSKYRLKSIDDSAVKKPPIYQTVSLPITQSESDIGARTGGLAVDLKSPQTHIPFPSTSRIQSESNHDPHSNPQGTQSRVDRSEPTRSEAKSNSAVHTPLPSTASIRSGQPSNPQRERPFAANLSKPTRSEEPTIGDSAVDVEKSQTFLLPPSTPNIRLVGGRPSNSHLKI